MTQETLKLTLEYMNKYYPSYAKQAAHHHKVTTAIKEALAQTQEPVAWMYVNKDGECEQIEYGEQFDDPSTTPLYTSPPQRTEQNFCSRCGKRTADLTVIHTCTPPQGNT